jgi:hypothetical protein
MQKTEIKGCIIVPYCQHDELRVKPLFSIIILNRLTVALAFTLIFLATTSASFGQPPRGARECGPGLGSEEQRNCDKQFSEQLRNSSGIVTLAQGWQLVKTKSPTGGQDAISVMHVADSGKSDIGLAGLSLKCGQERQRIDVIVILLDRWSRTDRPKIVLTSPTGRAAEFEASVTQAGEALLLPKSASELVQNDWQSATELNVEIDGKAGQIRGVIPVSGLAAAVRTLLESCAGRER